MRIRTDADPLQSRPSRLVPPARSLVPLLAFFGCTALSDSARAGNPLDAVVCVSQEALGPSPTCSGIPCGTVYPSFAEAQTAVASLPDLPSGSRPYVQLCLLGSSHIESVALDNSGDILADPLEVNFFGHLLCPDVSSPLDQAVFEFATGSSDLLLDLLIDVRAGAGCASGPRPGLHLFGGGSGTVAGSLRGTSGFAIATGLGGPAPTVALEGVAVSDCRGTALDVAGHATLRRVEIAGCRVDAETGGDALIIDRTVDGVGFFDSVLYGNYVDGSGGGPSALFRGQLYGFERTLVAANAVSGNLPMFLTAYNTSTYVLDGDVVSGAPDVIVDSVFSRNVQLAPGQDVVVPEAAPSTFPPVGTPACAGAPVTAAYESRPDPFASYALDPTGAPLFRVTPSLGPASGAEWRVLRSFFVANATGAAPLIEAVAAGSALRTQVIQNTFAANDSGGVAQLIGTYTDATAYVLRNLWVPSPDAAAPSAALTQVDGTPWYLVVSANVAPEGVSWFDAPATPPSGWIVGPQTTVSAEALGPAAFLDPVAVRSTPPTDRFRLVCPASPTSTEAEYTPRGWRLPCAVDLAAEWIPAPAFVESLPAPWPWTTPFFDPGRLGWEAPGATGWDCTVARGTVDRIPGNPPWGDGDGFPDAVDCDNDDASVRPRVPTWDGYTSPYCDDAESPCYQCPPGSLPPPGDDDTGDDDSGDDDASPGDDDDSGDDDAVVDDDDGGSSMWIEGCRAGPGCGASWSCGTSGSAATVALGPLLAALARRRVRVRRPRCDSAPRGADALAVIACAPRARHADSDVTAPTTA